MPPALKFDSRGASAIKSEEMLPIVEESGAVIGQSPRSYCHNGEKQLHPVVHLHIMDREGKLYLQKRAMTKKLLPGRWDTAVGGHISYGESVQEALFRESSEELGFHDFNPVFIKDYVYESGAEKELVFVWAAIGCFKLVPNEEEVDEGRFWSAEEIKGNIGKNILTPNFEHEFETFYKDILALL